MKKIIDECKKAGLPVPEFDYDRNGLMVEFKGRPAEASEKTSVQSRENVGETSGEKENGGKMAGKWRENGGKVAGKILEVVKANPEITIPELASNIGISIRTIERNIQKLQKENLLTRVGAANGGCWEVLD